MRQVLYVSHSTCVADPLALDKILIQSRTNNALDGVTGLLWSDGERFAQVIEGDEAAIADVMARIVADPRHRDIEILHDRAIAVRQFGSWSMELRTAEDVACPLDERMWRMLADASDAIRRSFVGLVASA